MKNMSIHQRIRAGRKRLGMTEQQFADAVGVSRAAVQQWEKEGGTAPKRNNQAAVAKLLGISVAELVDDASPASSGLSAQALALGQLFDELTDRVERARAWNAASEAILRVIQQPASVPAAQPALTENSQRSRNSPQR